MKRYIRVFSYFLKFSLINLTIYRGDIAFRNLGYLIESMILIIFFKVLYLKTAEINGWQFNDLLLILAAYNLLDWIIYFFYEPNHRELSQKVNRGELDFPLTKPVDAQFLVSFTKADLHSFSGLLVGAGLIFYVLKSSFNLGGIIAYVLVFLAGVVIHYAISLSLVTISFFSPRMEDFRHIEGRFRDLTFYPVDIYPPLLRFVFRTVLPIAFFATVPAQAFSNLSPRLFMQVITVMVVFFVFSRKFFLFGLKRYSSASS